MHARFDPPWFVCGASREYFWTENLMKKDADDYWKANVSLIIKLLIIWFIVPFLGGIVFVDVLNQVSIVGYPLGFWIAQQGSIYLFVVLIFYYAKKMSDLDDQYGGGE